MITVLLDLIIIYLDAKTGRYFLIQEIMLESLDAARNLVLTEEYMPIGFQMIIKIVQAVEKVLML